jgi:hypothetical protein
MTLEQIIKLKLNNFEIKVPVAKGDTPAADQGAKQQVNLADYPWEQCIADQTEKYGDEETAKKVCGAIKAMYGSKEEMEINPNPCWDGYEPIGLKEDGSPNCVPVKEKQSKEKFVIPSPEGGEDENTFISRCISDISAEYDAEGQAYAVCKDKWDKG